MGRSSNRNLNGAAISLIVFPFYAPAIMLFTGNFLAAAACAIFSPAVMWLGARLYDRGKDWWRVDYEVSSQ